jgi:hypothetical protein
VVVASDYRDQLDLTVENGVDLGGGIIPAYEAWGSETRFGMVALKYAEIFWFVCMYESHKIMKAY